MRITINSAEVSLLDPVLFGDSAWKPGVTYPWTKTAEFCTVLTQNAEAVNVIKNASVKNQCNLILKMNIYFMEWNRKT